MSDVAIRAEGIGKYYRIGERLRRRHLREAIVEAATAPYRRLAQNRSERAERTADVHGIWALRDVSFEIQHGEAVGFVGRNGAGKSTLLKILSRITEPTEGRAEIHGRIGSLLEVGAGFQADLTGRENVLLNGAILGMKKAEIHRKFDEIVAFSEIEQFIDTPVKFYSSGMYMRLAFSVAAHLDPEILLVDEALAVGDAAFQRKSLMKMGEIARTGRTVLFVSHHMSAIESICNRVIWLENGRVMGQGTPSEIINTYLHTTYRTVTSQVWPDPEMAAGNARVRLHRASVHACGAPPDDPITVRMPIELEFEYWNLVPGARLTLCVDLHNEHGIVVFSARPVLDGYWRGRPRPVGLYRESCLIPGDLLNDVRHSVVLRVLQDDVNEVYVAGDVLVFDVADDYSYRDAWYGKWPGIVRPLLEWRTELLEEGPPSAGRRPQALRLHS